MTTESDVERWITKTLADAPPLTEGQRRRVARILQGAVTESFTCPCCGRTSYNSNDVREGYCGSCHDWTGA